MESSASFKLHHLRAGRAEYATTLKPVIALTTQHVRARYVAVLTPTEVRWKVRVFQAEPE